MSILIRSARDVEEPQVAAVHVDDALAVERRPARVVVRVLRVLAHVGAVRQRREDVHHARAIGQEEEAPAVPHREAVRALPVRDLAERRRLDVPHPEVVGLAAAIALPRAILERPAVERHRAAVRRDVDLAHRADLDRTRLTAAHRHLGEEGLAVRIAPAVTVEDRAAVRAPAHHLLVIRREREAPRLAAGGRHHVDVHVALVLAGKGKPRAVRAQPRKALGALVRRQPRGGAPVHAHLPQIAFGHEHHAIAAQRGETVVADDAGVHRGHAEQEHDDRQ